MEREVELLVSPSDPIIAPPGDGEPDPEGFVFTEV